MSGGKLLRHVVLFKYKDEVTDAQFEEVGKAFLALPAQIPEIQRLEWGHAINANASYTCCLLVMFSSEADLKVYMEHPAHHAVSAAYDELAEGISIFDYWADV